MSKSSFRHNLSSQHYEKNELFDSGICLQGRNSLQNAGPGAFFSQRIEIKCVWVGEAVGNVCILLCSLFLCVRCSSTIIGRFAIICQLCPFMNDDLGQYNLHLQLLHSDLLEKCFCS